MNGKVKTISVYVGPVHAKRKRRGGFLGGLTLGNLAVGSLLVATLTLKGKMGPPGGKAHPPAKPTEPVRVHRAKQTAQKEVERLDKHYGIDKTDAASFNASRARLPKEMFEEYQRAQMAAWRGVDAERPKGVMSPDMKEFSERVQRAREASVSAVPQTAAPISDERREWLEANAPYALDTLPTSSSAGKGEAPAPEKVES